MRRRSAAARCTLTMSICMLLCFAAQKSCVVEAIGNGTSTATTTTSWSASISETIAASVTHNSSASASVSAPAATPSGNVTMSLNSSATASLLETPTLNHSATLSHTTSLDDGSHSLTNVTTPVVPTATLTPTATLKPTPTLEPGLETANSTPTPAPTPVPPPAPPRNITFLPADVKNEGWAAMVGILIGLFIIFVFGLAVQCIMRRRASKVSKDGRIVEIPSAQRRRDEEDMELTEHERRVGIGEGHAHHEGGPGIAITSPPPRYEDAAFANVEYAPQPGEATSEHPRGQQTHYPQHQQEQRRAHSTYFADHHHATEAEAERRQLTAQQHAHSLPPNATRASEREHDLPPVRSDDGDGGDFTTVRVRQSTAHRD